MIKTRTHARVENLDSYSHIYHLLSFDFDDVDAVEIYLELELEEYKDENFEMISKLIEKYIASGYIPKVRLKTDFKSFTIKEFEKFIDIESSLKDQGCEFCVVENKYEYSLDETISAYINCRKFADYIKTLNASPFEKYLIIYRYVTTFVYKENKEFPHNARNLIPVLNGNDIVCVGYSEIMSFLCKEAGILCKTQKLETFNEKTKKKGLHQNNFVYLKDEKYGIDGFYYVDACWDSIKKSKEPFLRYLFAALPLNDSKCFKSKKLKIDDACSILYNEKLLDELLLNQSMIFKIANKFGIDFDLKDLVPLYIRRPVEEGSKLFFATELLRQKMFQAGIKPDFYDSEKYYKIPSIFYPEYLLTQIILEPPQIERLDEIIGMMKNFQQNGYDAIDCQSYITEYLDDSSIINIYDELDDFKSGELNLNIWDIEKYYLNFQFVSKFREIFENIRSSSVAISEDIFERAMINSLIVEGYDEKYAKTLTAKAIKKTERLAEIMFNEDAENCFNEKAKEKRKEK